MNTFSDVGGVVTACISITKTDMEYVCGVAVTIEFSETIRDIVRKGKCKKRYPAKPLPKNVVPRVIVPVK